MISFELSHPFNHQTVKLHFPEQQLGIFHGNTGGKTWLGCKKLLAESSRVKLVLEQLKAGKTPDIELSKPLLQAQQLPDIKYYDASTASNKLNLLSALKINKSCQEDFNKSAEIRCCNCQAYTPCFKINLIKQISLDYQDQEIVLAVQVIEEESFKKLQEKGYGNFIYQNQIITNPDKFAEQVNYSSCAVIIDRLTIKSSNLDRLQASLEICNTIASVATLIATIKNDTLINKLYYHQQQLVCQKCGAILNFNPNNFEANFGRLDYQYLKIASHNYQNTPIADLLPNLPPTSKLAKVLIDHFPLLKNIGLDRLTLTETNLDQQTILALLGHLLATKSNQFLILDHTSLYLSTNKIKQLLPILQNTAKNSRGVLIIDNHPLWRTAAQYSCQNHDNGKLEFSDQLTGYTHEPINLDCQFLENLEDLLTPERIKSGGLNVLATKKVRTISEDLLVKLKLRFNNPQLISRATLEPQLADTIANYLRINKFFAHYLSKTIKAKSQAWNVNVILAAPEKFQELIFKDYSYQSFMKSSVQVLLDKFCNFPDLYSYLKLLNSFGLGRLPLNINFGELSRSQIDRIKLIRKTLTLPKSCDLILIEEPVIAQNYQDEKIFWSALETLDNKTKIALVSKLPNIEQQRCFQLDS